MTNETFIKDLTVGEFTSLLRAVISEVSSHQRTVRGYSGLADLLGCSTATIKRYMPILKPAVARRGRTIVADADKVLALWAGRKSQTF